MIRNQILKPLHDKQIFNYLCTHISGRLAEWLGNGLQNRVRRFESAIDLKHNSDSIDIQYYRFFIWCICPIFVPQNQKLVFFIAYDAYL